MPTIHSTDSADFKISRVLDELEAAHCVALPTETVYGLAADATNGLAVAKIFEMKGRPNFNPLICHVSGLQMARKHGVFDDIALRLAKAFWPGSLTIVLPLKQNSTLHPLVSAGLDTIGLRQPKGMMTDIIEAFGKPLAAPSANPSGKVSPTTAQHVAEEFADGNLLIVDGGACEVGLESTIVKVDGNTVLVLRPGAITAGMIKDATGITPMTAGGNAKVEAPGMMQSHYAPAAKVTLKQTVCPEGAALLAFGNADGKDRSGATASINLSPGGDLREAAANLYRAIKTLDESGTNNICVEPVPESGLGIAINDRLSRAAAPRTGGAKP